MANPPPVDSTAFTVFEVQELTPASFDAGLVLSGDELAVVFFWGLDCFNCEIAKKAMLSQPDAICALGMRPETRMTARQAAKVRAIEKN